MCLDVSTQVIAELQTSLSSIKEDSRQTQQGLERQLQEAQSRWDEERRQLNKNADQTSKVRKRKYTHVIVSASRLLRDDNIIVNRYGFAGMK